MGNPEPRPSLMSGLVNSCDGIWYKCINPNCGIVDLREGALLESKDKFVCPNCGIEVVEDIP